MSARLQLAGALVDGSSDDLVADAAALAGLEVAPSYTVLAPGGRDDPVSDPAAVLSLLPEPVIAGVASGCSAGGGVSIAARTALEGRDLAIRLGRPPGCHGIADVALEYQTSRPGPGQQAPAATVSPLGPEPALTSTLRTFVEESGHRRRTARRLGVHPDTVDNRTRRIAVLTGLDPHHPRDMTWLEAALAASRLLSQV